MDIYYIPSRQRRISLRFLSWFVLEQNIQTGEHDSIEDALSALRLYKAYQIFETEGIFDQKLDEISRLLARCYLKLGEWQVALRDDWGSVSSLVDRRVRRV